MAVIGSPRRASWWGSPRRKPTGANGMRPKPPTSDLPAYSAVLVGHAGGPAVTILCGGTSWKGEAPLCYGIFHAIDTTAILWPTPSIWWCSPPRAVGLQRNSWRLLQQPGSCSTGSARATPACAAAGNHRGIPLTALAVSAVATALCVVINYCDAREATFALPMARGGRPGHQLGDDLHHSS